MFACQTPNIAVNAELGQHCPRTCAASMSGEHEPFIVLPFVCLLDKIPQLRVLIPHRDNLSQVIWRETCENGEAMSFRGELF